MRILVLNYEYPPLGGGAGNATYFLCREWGKLAIQTDVVTTWFTGYEPVTKESDNVTIFRVHSWRKKKEQSNVLEMLSYVNKGFAKAKALCKQNKYDCVISFFGFPVGIIAYRLFKQMNIPYVILLRGGDVPGFLPKQLGIFHAITLSISKQIWQNAKCIIANSKSLQTLATKTGQSIKRFVDIVPNGVDVNFFYPTKNLVKKPFVFIFVGRFVSQKNLPYLLQQFDLANNEGLAQLFLVGEGPEHDAIVSEIAQSKNLVATVQVYPWSSKDSLLSLYQKSHCFVNPSLEEGMPNTLLEAMACGLPSIVSNVGGNNELVEHGKTGYLFDLQDTSSLSVLMHDIIHDSNCTQMGENAQNLVVAKYSWASSAKQIMEKTKNAI